MYRFYTLVIFMLCVSNMQSQNTQINKIINKIEFEGDTILAVFDWVADNIKYDIAKVKNKKKRKAYYKEGNFKSLAEYEASLLKDVIKRKKGVCQDYTLLFKALMDELGYQSHIVTGITKDRKGKINKKIGHTWMAIRHKGKWKLYDPTWGAGYIKDDAKFVKNYNAKWYETNPSVMIENHYPYDPIWQLSERPLSFDEFKNGTNPDASTRMNYTDLIETYLSKKGIERSKDKLTRLDQSEPGINLINKHREYLLEKIKGASVPEIIGGCQRVTQTFNEYLSEGKNKRFKEQPWTKDYAMATMKSLETEINDLIIQMQAIKPKGRQNRKSISKNIKQAKQIMSHIKKENTFLNGL